jgi:hypothetical protein
MRFKFNQALQVNDRERPVPGNDLEFWYVVGGLSDERGMMITF